MIKMFEPTTTARQDNISKGQTEKHSHNRLAGQDRTTRKGQSGQEGQPGRDRRERAGRETRPGKVSQTRLLELDSQDRTGQSGEKLAHYQKGFFYLETIVKGATFSFICCRNSLAKNLFGTQLILKTPSAAHFHIVVY
jgi:hypothetical protein